MLIKSFARTRSITCFLSLALIFLTMMPFAYSKARVIAEEEVVIVGGGIAGALHAYQAYQEAVQRGTNVRVTICERYKSLAETTAANAIFSLTPDEIVSVLPRGKALLEKLQFFFNEPGGISVDTNFHNQTTTTNIVPSLTPDEMLSVVPRGKALVEKLQYAFNQPGGIRVDDVAHVNDSQVATNFIKQAEVYSHDDAGYNERTKTLLALGKMSMDLWQKNV